MAYRDGAPMSRENTFKLSRDILKITIQPNAEIMQCRISQLAVIWKKSDHLEVAAVIGRNKGTA